ncbi:hypothetical protein F5Y04DRAFT_290698 [Hypomontagnella monticulosa]|nr:hypothetical protein F5Y04DRAFT_290698 [Hypomontagnella monticulosa]
MTFQSALRLLILTGTSSVLAQVYANGPFQLRISSLTNVSISGHAYPCDDQIGLCFLPGDPRTLASDEGFFFMSRAAADLTTGYLSWRKGGPIGLIYDPGSNVAVPEFNQTNSPETLGFETSTGNLMMSGVDDTDMNRGGAGAVGNRNYNNWYLCLIPLGNFQAVLVSWVLGANLGWQPTNPTCQAINLTLQTGVGYGGPVRLATG